MKCPRCGLVHAASDQVCRRCEIDLRTGEARPRAQSCLAVEASVSPFERLAGMIPGRAKARAEAAALQISEAARADRQEVADRRRADATAAAPPAAAPSEAHVRAETARKAAGFFRAQKDKVRLPAFMRGKAEKDAPPMSCVQCSEPMRVVRENPYPFWQTLALWVLGAGLLIAGVFFHLLIVTGILAVVAGFFFHRLGGSHWRCSSCGMIVPRAR